MENKNNAAIVAYLTIFGAVIAIFMNSDEKKSEFASFHIRQALGIFISFFLLGYFVSYFDSWMATASFYFFYFILWIFGFIGALQGQLKLIPILGKLFQNIFKAL